MAKELFFSDSSSRLDTKNNAHFTAIIGIPLLTNALLVATAFGVNPNTIIALVLFAFITVVTLYNIELGLLILLLLRSSIDVFRGIDLPVIVPIEINLAGLLTVSIVVLGALYIWLNKISITKLPGIRLLLCLIALTLVSVLFSPVKYVSMQDWLRLLSMFIVYVLAANIFVSQSRIKTLLVFIVLSSMFPVIYAIYQSINDLGIHSGIDLVRISSTFAHPNPFAFFLDIMIALSFVTFMVGLRNKKSHGFLAIAAFGILILQLIALYLTQTRGAWIGLLMIVILASWYYNKRIMFLALLVIIPLVFLVPGILNRFSDIYAPANGAALSSFWWRIDFWNQYYGLIIDKPIFGHGIGSFSYYAEGMFAHNDHLRLLVEVGVVGWLIYLAIFFAIIKNAVNALKVVDVELFKALLISLIAIVSAYLLMSFSDNIITQNVLQWYLWSLAGAAAALSRTVVKSEPAMLQTTRCI